MHTARKPTLSISMMTLRWTTIKDQQELGAVHFCFGEDAPTGSVDHYQERRVFVDVLQGHGYGSDGSLHSDKNHQGYPLYSFDEHGLAFRTGAAPYSISKGGSNISRSRKRMKIWTSLRETRLTKAWERKRELMLSEHMVNGKKSEMSGFATRSHSDHDIAGGHGACLDQSRFYSRSLMDADFEELRGCFDLGFRFDHRSVSELYDTFPALKVYHAVAQAVRGSPNNTSLNSLLNESSRRCSFLSPDRSWRIASPGDDPEDVKGRLRHWAQAVACDPRLFHRSIS
ncbi:hypothetical protein KP509_07G055300 [Ceratopteris richardii]|uniref:Uncharacterized protein n=1 Tax=Ceratopteris richardii TaxID=49495 RepID=A0A8T2UCG6_CERRI|nr:hypothetical protein KP509_07G055300 [Ceratopteris richardii]